MRNGKGGSQARKNDNFPDLEAVRAAAGAWRFIGDFPVVWLESSRFAMTSHNLIALVTLEICNRCLSAFPLQASPGVCVFPSFLSSLKSTWLRYFA